MNKEEALMIIWLCQVVLAVMVYGMVFADNADNKENSFMKDNRSRHAWSVFPAFMTLIPFFGIVAALAFFVSTDFARHGIRFR